MLTITGTIKDIAGAARAATVEFTPLSTPLAVGSTITITGPKTVVCGSDGALPALQLAAGDYRVAITWHGVISNFQIAVPDSNDTATLVSLITTSLVYTYTSAPGYLPLGGTKGQSLYKKSATDHDVGWADGPIYCPDNDTIYFLRVRLQDGVPQLSLETT